MIDIGYRITQTGKYILIIIGLIGYRITQTGKYILIIIGGLLILAGIIIAIISIIRSRKSKKSKKNQDELFDIIQNESQEEIQTKIKGSPRRRRSNKY